MTQCWRTLLILGSERKTGRFEMDRLRTSRRGARPGKVARATELEERNTRKSF